MKKWMGVAAVAIGTLALASPAAQATSGDPLPCGATASNTAPYDAYWNNCTTANQIVYIAWRPTHPTPQCAAPGITYLPGAGYAGAIYTKGEPC
jgi:hypothetical protein